MNIPKRMQAAVLIGPGDVRLVESAEPRSGRVIKVAACGLCGTDLKVVGKGLPGQPPYGDFTIGHEYVGAVAAVGENVDEFNVGDRVAVEVHKGCGRCRNCIDGQYTSCLNYGRPEKGHRANGLTTDGGFAEYALNHVNTLHRLPDQVTFEQAVLVTTGGNPLYAIQRCGGLVAGDFVVVLGPGPIGLMAVQICKALGAAAVVLAGTRQQRLRLGRELGADVTVNIQRENIVECVHALTGGIGADLVLECSGSSTAPQQALDLVRKGGNVAIVSFYHEPVTIDLSSAVLNNVRLIAARGEGGGCCRRVLSLMAAGRVVADPLITHTFPLKQINEAFETLSKRTGDPLKVIIHPQED